MRKSTNARSTTVAGSGTALTEPTVPLIVPVVVVPANVNASGPTSSFTSSVITLARAARNA